MNTKELFPSNYDGIATISDIKNIFKKIDIPNSRPDYQMVLAHEGDSPVLDASNGAYFNITDDSGTDVYHLNILDIENLHEFQEGKIITNMRRKPRITFGDSTHDNWRFFGPFEEGTDMDSIYVFSFMYINGLIPFRQEYLSSLYS